MSFYFFADLKIIANERAAVGQVKRFVKSYFNKIAFTSHTAAIGLGSQQSAVRQDRRICQ